MVLLIPFYIAVFCSEIYGLVCSIKATNVFGIVLFSFAILLELLILFGIIFYNHQKIKVTKINDCGLIPFNDYGAVNAAFELAERNGLANQVSSSFQYGIITYVPYELGCEVIVDGKHVATMTLEDSERFVYYMSNFELVHRNGEGGYGRLFFKNTKDRHDKTVFKKRQYDFIALAIKYENNWHIALDLPIMNRN